MFYLVYNSAQDGCSIQRLIRFFKFCDYCSCVCLSSRTQTVSLNILCFPDLYLPLLSMYWPIYKNHRYACPVLMIWTVHTFSQFRAFLQLTSLICFKLQRPFLDYLAIAIYKESITSRSLIQPFVCTLPIAGECFNLQPAEYRRVEQRSFMA